MPAISSKNKDTIQTSFRDLREVIMNAPIGIFISSPEGKLLNVNPALARMYGYDSPEQAMESITDAAAQIYMEPEHRKELISMLKARGEVVGFETRHKRRDGSIIWVSINIRLEHDSQGLPSRLSGFIMDITGYRLAREQLEQEIVQRKMLFDQSRDGIVILDSRGYVYEANEQFARMLGYTPEECADLHVSDWDAQWSREELIKMQQEVGPDGDHFETLHRRRDGSVFSVEISTNGLDTKQGKLIFCVCRDITERKKAEERLKRSEERFQKMLSVIPDMISFHDPDMNIKYSNWKGFAAVPHEKRILNTKCYKTYRGWDRICPDCLAVNVLRTKEPIQTEVELPEKKWVDLRVIPVLDDDGSVEFFVEWVRDITDQKRAEQRIRESEARLSLAQQYAQVGFWEYDISSGSLYWSKECEVLFGLDQGEFPGTYEAFLDRVHPDDREYVINSNQPIFELEQGVCLNYEHRIIRKDGTVRWVKETASLFENPGNPNRRVIGFAVDITSRKQTEEELRRQESLKHLLMDLATRSINAPLEKIDETISEILEKTGRFTGADRLYIFEHDHEAQTTANTHEWCARGIRPQIDNLQSTPFAFFRDMLDSFAKGEAVHIPNVSEMPENQEMRRILKEQDIKSVVMLPMLQEGKNIGFVGFDSVKKTRIFTENEINILKILAEIISNILARQQAEKTIRLTTAKLREMAMTDELTGLGNRRWFFTQGKKEIQRSKRFNMPLSLLMIDLDYFKKVNDTFGHEAGDIVLQKIASVLEDNIRQIDVIARLGGEEFCVLLPGSNEQEAAVLAERLRQAVEQTTCLIRGRSVGVTVSIGLVSGRNEELSIDLLLSRVDAALYEAKGKGRNQVVIASGF